MFLDAINHDVKAILNELSRECGDTDFFVCSSGDFVVERILSKNNFKNIYGNDVSICSCFIGNYLVGKSMPIEIINPDYKWLSNYLNSDIDKIATLLICSEYFKYTDKDSLYFKRIDNAYREQFKNLHSKTSETVKFLLEQTKLKNFFMLGPVDFIESIPQNCTVIGRISSYESGQDNLSKKFDEIFYWDKPVYEVLDKERFNKFNQCIREKRNWIIWGNKEIFDLQSYLIGRVQNSLKGKSVYVYSNVYMKSKLVMPRQQIEPVFFKRATEKLSGDLRIINLSMGQLNTLRSEYLSKGIECVAPDVSFGIAIGEELIGAVAFSKTNYCYNFSDVYMMSDFCISPSIYRKLSKLVLVAVLSTEMQSLLEQRFSCEIKTIGTTAFTKKAVSMKYRGLFELYSRKDSMLNYIARAGKWSLKEGYKWWENNHSQMALIK